MATIEAYQASRPPLDRATLCNAPSINLNFEQNGNVTACCYNRKHVLGTWPRDSISAMWKGPKLRELRRALREGDLSKGCGLCSEQLAAGNFRGMRSRYFDSDFMARKGSRRAGMPRAMEFELSNACNLECVMCNGYFSSAIRRRREKLAPLPRVYGPEFIEELRPFLGHLEWARFLGGEPFLNPLYFRLWDALAECNPGVRVAITTNGTVLDDRVMKVVERLRPDIVVSIDSLDPATFERIRKGASFREVMSHLQWFLETARSQGREVSLAACPMRENWREIPALVSFCNFQRVQIAFNTMLWPEELSLRTMGARELGEVESYLSAARGKFVSSWGPSELARRNAAAYDGLIRQVRAWQPKRASLAEALR
jgi:MoaA/NifB/PqqE/SkfB family radical SAM enzyme